MSVSRQDFEAIAAIFAGELATLKGPEGLSARNRLRNVIKSTADYFARSNPRFDRNHFYKAAGHEFDQYGTHPEMGWRFAEEDEVDEILSNLWTDQWAMLMYVFEDPTADSKRIESLRYSGAVSFEYLVKDEMFQ